MQAIQFGKATLITQSEPPKKRRERLTRLEGAVKEYKVANNLSDDDSYTVSLKGNRRLVLDGDDMAQFGVDVLKKTKSANERLANPQGFMEHLRYGRLNEDGYSANAIIRSVAEGYAKKESTDVLDLDQ